MKLNYRRQSGVWHFAAILSSLGSAISWIYAFITISLASYAFKFTVFTLTISVYLAVLAGLYLGISEVLELVSDSLPSLPTEVTVAASWVVPPNIGQFFTAIASIGLLKLVYVHKNRIIDIAGRTAS